MRLKDILRRQRGETPRPLSPEELYRRHNLSRYSHLPPDFRPDPYEEARDIVAWLCRQARKKGVWVYEKVDDEKIEIYWETRKTRIKVYETGYRLKDNDMLKIEVMHILSLVSQADRLLNEGVDKELVFSLLERARKTKGRVSFVVREDRIEVYDGVVLKKTFYRKLQA